MAGYTYNPEALAALVEPIAQRVAVQVESAAKQLCPVDTGRLRSSITHTVTREGSSYRVTVGTNVEYAPFIELGTRYMSAQPFLRPALDAVRL